MEVELREQSGAPAAAGVVRFALVGDARDGSVSPVVARVDPATGLARAEIRAPSDGASLRVRASADGAPDAYLDVSVSARGFGGISITSRYTGVRSPDRLEFRIYDGVTCAAADRAEPVRPVPPLPPSGGAIEFSGLAAGRTFTVRADAVGAGGVLATDCVDGLTVARDKTLYLPMQPVDLPLPRQGHLRPLAAARPRRGERRRGGGLGGRRARRGHARRRGAVHPRVRRGRGRGAGRRGRARGLRARGRRGDRRRGRGGPRRPAARAPWRRSTASPWTSPPRRAARTPRGD